MRSIFAISFLVFIAVCAAGYGISWYSQALYVRHSLEQFIDAINAKQKYITYESIEISGFPSDLNVAIVKPHFKGRVDELLKNVNINGRLPYANLKEWMQDISLDGKIALGINALSDRYTMNTSGNWSQSIAVGGQTFASITRPQGNSSCVLQLKRESGLFDALWNFKSLNRDGKTLIRDFRMLDCSRAGEKSTDPTGNNLFSTLGPSRLYITNTPKNGINQVRFYLQVADAEITPLGDAEMLAYYHGFLPDRQFPSFSAYGKQNIDIDFTYSGPENLQPTDQNQAMDVVLNKMDITNQLYNEHMAFHFDNIPTPGNRTMQLSFRNESAFNEPYDATIQPTIHNTISELYTSNNPRLREIQATVQKYKPDELYAIIQPAIPNFHALGKMVLALDSNFKGSDDFKSGDFTLNNFEISAKSYGIAGKGELNSTQKPPALNLQVSCANCLQMIDDMAAYTDKLQKIMSYFDTQKSAAMKVDPARINAIKQFLTALSPASAMPSTLTFVIAGSGPGTTINNKPVAEVIQLYNDYMQPTLKQQPASRSAPQAAH